MALSSPADLTATTALGVLQAIIPALFMNVCIVGFNQLCDVEIDKVSARAAYIPHCAAALLRWLTRHPCASGEQAVPSAR